MYRLSDTARAAFAEINTLSASLQQVAHDPQEVDRLHARMQRAITVLREGTEDLRAHGPLRTDASAR